MKPPVPTVMDPERPLRMILGYALLVGLPLVVVLLVMAVKFEGLTTPPAWEHAQLARHLAAGDGFVTSVIRPLASKSPNHPDLYNAPLHPLALASFFRLIGPSDKCAGMVGLLCWVGTIWLTFLVARRSWGGRAAALAAVLYAGNVIALTTAANGLPYPVSTLLVLLAIWLSAGVCLAQELSVGQTILAGLSCGLVVLTDFALTPLVVVAGFYLVILQKKRVKTGAAFAAGLLVPVLPWVARNAWIDPDNLFGLAWYNLATNTRTLPGHTVWGLPQPPVPLVHLAEIGRKFSAGLFRFLQHAPYVLSPTLTVLFLVSLPAAVKQPKTRSLAVLTLVSLGVCVLVACLFQPEPVLLTAWSPLLAIVAGSVADDWISKRVGPISLNWLRIATPPTGWLGRNSAQAQFFQAALWGRSLAYAGLLICALAPLGIYLFLSRPAARPAWEKILEPVRQLVPATGVVMTDQPALVAWYGNRCALSLLTKESDWQHLPTLGASPAAVFLVGPVPADAPDWWSWLASPRGTYRGLVPVVPSSSGATLKVQPARPPADNRARELEQARSEVKQSPEAAEAHVRLGLEFLIRDRLREASEEFQWAAYLDAENPEARLGIWQVAARLQDTDNALDLVQRALQGSPAAGLLNDASVLLNRVLAKRPNDPWLLLMAALCHARLQDWPAARAACQRVEKLAPQALPAGALLTTLYLQQRMVNEAAKEVERLRDQHPRHAAVQELLGKVRKQQGRWEEALQAFQLARQLRPSRQSPHLEAGLVLLRLRRPDEASVSFTALLNLSPQSLPGRLGLAEALLMQGQRDAAIRIHEGLLAEFPDNLMVLNNLASLLCEAGRDFDRAVSLAQRAVELAPQNAGVKDTLGWVYYRLGRYEDALRQFQSAAHLAPEVGLVRYHVAKCLWAMSRRDDAVAALKRAIGQGLPPDELADAQALLRQP